MAFAVCGLAAAVYRDPPGRIAGVGRARRPRRRRPSCEIEQGLPCVTGDEEADRAAVRPGFLAVVRSRDILLLGLAAMFLCMVEFAALAHLVLFLHLDWAYSVVAAAGLLAVCQAAGAFGKPLSGLVSDRLLGRRRKAPLLALAGLAGLACAILALLGPGHTWLLWAALVMLGVGAVGWGGLFGTLAGETAGPAAAGAAAGVTAAIDNVGIFIGPPLFGLIVDRSGSYAPAWWAMVGAAVLAACSARAGARAAPRLSARPATLQDPAQSGAPLVDRLPVAAVAGRGVDDQQPKVFSRGSWSSRSSDPAKRRRRAAAPANSF